MITTIKLEVPGYKITPMGMSYMLIFHEHRYIKRLQKYYNDHYLRYDDEVEWYGNPEPNQWRFRIPSKKWEVSLTCDDKGNITDRIDQYEE